MIENNKVVTLNYKLTEAGNSELIEETYGSEPLSFIYGIGAMLPQFEANLTNLKNNDKFNFVIKAVDAYGDIDESAITEIPLNAFSSDGKIDEEIIQIGKTLPMQDKDGNQFEGIIVDINDDSVVMDFNHPLAGIDLNFEGEIVDVRDATEEELDHGHIHGAHHHQNNDEDHECTNCGHHH